MSTLKLFGLAVLIGIAGILGWNAIRQPTAQTRTAPAVALTGTIRVSEQIAPRDLARFKSQGIQTVIDLRPDGEVPDQPSSTEMAQAAQRQGLRFAYVPVPHGDVPAATIDALAKAIADAPSPVLLYCRSARRAARAWALMEASRPGGLDVTAIVTRVKTAGQNADDLQAEIAQRIAARAPQDPKTP